MTSPFATLLSLLSCGLLLLSTTGCRGDDHFYSESGIFLTQDYHIEYQHSGRLMAEVDSILFAANQSLNAYNPTSTLAKVNRNEPVEVDDCFITVFEKANEVSQITQGIFDITCLPLVLFWRDNYTSSDRISPLVVDSIQHYVGYEKVQIAERRVVKSDPRIQITLTALAKGYTSDRIAALFDSKGIDNYLINLGGVVVAKGSDRQQQPWRAAIQRPEETTDHRTVALQEWIRVVDGFGISTFGAINDYYLKAGKKYAPVINPITGYPAEQNILSATILAVNGITADSFATALTALSLEEACRLGDSLPEIDYLFIYSDSTGTLQTAYSKGMSKYLIRRKQSPLK